MWPSQPEPDLFDKEKRHKATITLHATSMQARTCLSVKRFSFITMSSFFLATAAAICCACRSCSFSFSLFSVAGELALAAAALQTCTSA